MAKIGILGGSFDPVHLGHMLMGQDACENKSLDFVYLCPAAQSPLKAKGPQVGDEHRVAMLQACAQSWPIFRLWMGEIERGGTSYSVDTARAIAERHVGDEIYWIIGNDQLQLLPQWRSLDVLMQFVEFVVIKRPGYASTIPDGLEASRIHLVKGHSFAVSSSQIRSRLAAGLNTDFFLPQVVTDYILQNKLYLN